MPPFSGCRLQVLLALEHLHERNVVYRDLKPETLGKSGDPGGHVLYGMVEPGYPAKPFILGTIKWKKKGWEWFLKDLSYF